MAEFVDQSLCQIKEDLQKILEFSNAEKRKIYKRQAKFEYRIRRRKKLDGDFLHYITYLQDVLKLLNKRKRGGRTKSGTEVPIIMRVHNLYQLCETRFSQNTEVWLSHIEFCKKQKEYNRISRLFQQMLRTHADNPELWILAAQWEVQQSNVQSARGLMQRCISNNKTSRDAWIEYYKIEIELAKMVEEPSAKIAQLVASYAFQELPDDVDLLINMIKVAKKASFMKEHSDEMIQRLCEGFPHSPRVWEYLARSLLPTKKRALSRFSEEKEKRYFGVYKEAVEKVSTEEMWTLYLKASLEFCSLPAQEQETVQRRVQHTLQVFEEAAGKGCMSLDMYQGWVFLLKDQLRVEEAVKVCEEMINKFPTSASAWNQRLILSFQGLASPADVVACLIKALVSVPEKESWSLWESAFTYLVAAEAPELESLFEKACQRIVREVCMPAKLLFLRWTALTKDVKAVRALYTRMSVLKPVPLEFYLEYVEQELMEDSVKVKRVRRAFEDAVSDFGKSEPDVWLRYISMEMTCSEGDRSQASVLHNRATVNLPQGPLRDTFVQAYGDVVSMES